jgi:hypothetical protein
VFAENKSERSSIPGVEGIGYGINQCGYFDQIDVFARSASGVPAVRAQIPESSKALLVAVELPLTGKLLGYRKGEFPSDQVLR